MKTENVRLKKIAAEFERDEPQVEKLLVLCWNNWMALRRILTEFRKMSDDPTDDAKLAGLLVRETWVIGNESPLVDKQTLEVIARIAKDAEEGSAILEIVLADESSSDKPSSP